MIRESIQLACLLLLIASLAGAALSDIRRRRIPNMLCVLIAGLALPYWIAADPDIWQRLLIQLALCGIATFVLALLFARGMLGGGDVKLIVALLIWLPPKVALSTILLIAMAGGVVAIAMLVVTPLRRRKVAGAKVPYAVAITLGCMPWALSSIVSLTGRI
ncbi:MAG: peptidase prepilin type [Rhizorhabdus sp.]|nr:peptidase prepilin type [Rhizorhabdus sp.]